MIIALFLRKKYLNFLIFIVILFFAFESNFLQSSQNDLCKIKESSEIGYIVKYGGWHIGEDDPPILYQYSLTCLKNKAYKKFVNIWNDGRKKELRKKISIKKYLKLWREIEKYDIWNLKNIDLKELNLEVNGEYKEELNPYKSLPTEESTYEFFIRLKEKKHRFKAYAINYLKDKRYIKIRDVIKKFFRFLYDLG